MRATLRFNLPSGVHDVALLSDTDAVLSQTLNAYRFLVVPSTSNDVPAVRVCSSGDSYVAETPFSRYKMTPDGDQLRVDWEGPGGGRSWARGTSHRSVEGEGGGTTDASPLSHVSGLIERILLETLCHLDARLVCYHAAAVVRQGSCALLIGDNCAGKTTTSLELCGLGWKVATDDVAMIDIETATLWPLRRRPAIRENSVGFDAFRYVECCGTTDAEVRVRERYRADERWYPITDALILKGFGAAPSIAELGRLSGVLTLVGSSYTATRGGWPRLLEIAERLEGVRWWSCQLGSPSNSAVEITRLLAGDMAIAARATASSQVDRPDPGVRR